MGTAREELVRVARDLIDHGLAGTTQPADAVVEIPAGNYIDPEHFDVERRLLFGRVPLMVAAACEVAEPGDRRVLEIAGVPVIVVRGRDGAARVFLNACTHRGAMLADECGSSARLTCPYHGWVFDDTGGLVGVPHRQQFGDVDRGALGLRQFPSLERAGLIWAVLDPASTLDIDGFLGDFGGMLEHFRLDRTWHVSDDAR